MNDNRNDNSRIRVFPDPEQMSETAAALVLRAATSACRHSGTFSLALSGGSTPRPLHRLLSRESSASGMPWPATHLFWVDERMVPYDHPDSNFGTAKTDLLDHVPIPDAHVHPMPAAGNRGRGAARYDDELKTFFFKHNQSKPVFDLILLGVGPDGHVASLFPNQPESHDGHQWVIETEGGQPRVGRLTLTFFALNSAREILFLIAGDEKASIAASLVENRSKRLPVHRICPSSGKITYLMDQKAASGIPGAASSG